MERPDRDTEKEKARQNRADVTERERKEKNLWETTESKKLGNAEEVRKTHN